MDVLAGRSRGGANNSMINFKTKKRPAPPLSPTSPHHPGGGGVGNRCSKAGKFYKDGEVSFYKKVAADQIVARGLTDLNADELEHIARYLDTKSALCLLRACKVCRCRNSKLHTKPRCFFNDSFLRIRVKYTDSTNRHKQTQTDFNKGNSMHKEAINPPQTIF